MAKKDYDTVAIGSRIRSIRQEKGMTLEEFGNLFSASKSIASRWEKGISIPNAERLKAIAKVGDTSVENILYGSIEGYLYKRVVNLFHSQELEKYIADSYYSQENEGYVVNEAVRRLIEWQHADYSISDDAITHQIRVLLLEYDLRRLYTDYNAVESILDSLRQMINNDTFDYYFYVGDDGEGTNNEERAEEALHEGMNIEIHDKLYDILMEAFEKVEALKDEYNLKDEYTADILDFRDYSNRE